MKTRPLTWISGFLAIVVLGVFGWNFEREATADVVVYKSSECDCCNRWVANLQDHGFRVYVVSDDHLALVRAKFGVPDRLAACHTARAGKYTIEGHVPASAIRRLLTERPAVAGLAVPGMPIGSPGMEQGDRHDAYAVLAFDGKGHTSVFEQH
jgi:hypothetical protein